MVATTAVINAQPVIEGAEVIIKVCPIVLLLVLAFASLQIILFVIEETVILHGVVILAKIIVRNNVAMIVEPFLVQIVRLA